MTHGFAFCSSRLIPNLNSEIHIHGYILYSFQWAHIAPQIPVLTGMQGRSGLWNLLTPKIRWSMQVWAIPPFWCQLSHSGADKTTTPLIDHSRIQNFTKGTSHISTPLPSIFPSFLIYLSHHLPHPGPMPHRTPPEPKLYIFPLFSPSLPYPSLRLISISFPSIHLYN